MKIDGECLGSSYKPDLDSIVIVSRCLRSPFHITRLTITVRLLNQAPFSCLPRTQCPVPGIPFPGPLLQFLAYRSRVLYSSSWHTVPGSAIPVPGLLFQGPPFQFLAYRSWVLHYPFCCRVHFQSSIPLFTYSVLFLFTRPKLNLI